MAERQNAPVVVDPGTPGFSVPTRAEIYRCSADRLEEVVGDLGPVTQELARELLASERHLLAVQPATLWPIVVARAGASAGGDWHRAIWPAVALELAMTAADLCDDLADGEETEIIGRFGRGAVLTAAIGLISLAGSTVLRANEDGCEEAVTHRLGALLGTNIAAAVDGQLRSLRPGRLVRDVTNAYEIAAAKSGPLGDLAARLGAMTATTDERCLALYGEFGWHLAVSAQLVNDAADVMPNRPLKKHDVLNGCPTVPLTFAGSWGAPAGLDQDCLIAWETTERRRIAAEGGVLVAEVLAVADRLRAEQALRALADLGHETAGLRELLGGSLTTVHERKPMINGEDDDVGSDQD